MLTCKVPLPVLVAVLTDVPDVLPEVLEVLPDEVEVLLGKEEVLVEGATVLGTLLEPVEEFPALLGVLPEVVDGVLVEAHPTILKAKENTRMNTRTRLPIFFILVLLVYYWLFFPTINYNGV